MSTDCFALRNCIRQKVREMCFVGTKVSDDQIGKTKISDLHLGQGTQMPGVSPMGALVVKVAGCTDVNIPNLTENKLTNSPNWTVDDLAGFICAETKIIKGEI
jgi:hypothetical protein